MPSLEIRIVEFNYCLNPDAEKPIILINTHIGPLTNEDGTVVNGVMADEFTRELAELEKQGKTTVEIWFNTGGGCVRNGWGIYGAIQLSKMHITGLNIGIAASTGGWLFEGCHERIMMDYALIMMHNPHGGSTEGLAEFTESIATMLCAKTKKTKDEVLRLMAATTFINAEDAHAMGFCDEVRPSGTTISNAAPDLDWIWNKGNEFLNSILPVKQNSMKELINYINTFPGNKLADTADAAVVLAAFQKIKNDWAEDKANADKELKDAKDALDAANASGTNDEDYNALKDKFDALNLAVDKLNKDRADEMADRNEADCKDAVENAVKIGKIVNTTEAINFWNESGKKLGAATLKNMIATMPVNKAMPFGTPNDVAAGERDKDAPVVDVAEFKNKFKGEFNG